MRSMINNIPVSIINVAVVLLNVGLVIIPQRRETGF
jgi:hypothetical protein